MKDLEYLETQIKQRHSNPFWLHSEVKFDSLIEKVKYRIQTTPSEALDYYKIMTDLVRIVSFLGDGHTDITNRYKIFGKYPFNASWIGDGFYIYRTSDRHKRALGAKILSIDNQPIDTVYRRLKQVVGHSGKSSFHFLANTAFNTAGLLYGVGITNSPAKAEFLLEDRDGQKFTIIYEKINLNKTKDTEFVRLDQNLNEFPLYRQQRVKNYWFTYLEDKKTVYFNYRRTKNMKSESMSAFTKRLFSFLDSTDVQKLIIDVRDNSGGNNFLNTQLIEGIIKRPEINQKGKLFAIIGKNTFSAAISFIGDIETKTQAILVGSPVGDSPIHPGDAVYVKLPYSKLRVGISRFTWENTFYKDQRTTIRPEIDRAISIEDYIKGRDPVLEAAMNFKYETSNVNPQITKTDRSSYLGKYDFCPDKSLSLTSDQNVFYMQISGKPKSPIYSISNVEFETESQGMNIILAKNKTIIIKTPNGEERVLRKLYKDESKALDYIYSNELGKAETVYQSLKQQYPNLLSLKINNMSRQAWETYHQTGSFEKGKTLIEISKRLNGKSSISYGTLSYMNKKEGNKLQSTRYLIKAAWVYVVNKK